MSLVGSMTAFAEPVERIQIEDPAGDANYINDQVGPFLGLVNHGDVAAVSVIPQADIVKLGTEGYALPTVDQTKTGTDYELN